MLLYPLKPHNPYLLLISFRLSTVALINRRPPAVIIRAALADGAARKLSPEHPTRIHRAENIYRSRRTRNREVIPPPTFRRHFLLGGVNLGFVSYFIFCIACRKSLLIAMSVCDVRAISDNASQLSIPTDISLKSAPSSLAANSGKGA